ncbi:MAG: hypothetical protein IJ499_00930 [Clostridia bacterium]|nr:hypothetical protein [Clostridia bacterium]
MYNFRIKDEPFAVGYLTAPSDSIYVRCGAGYLNCARNMEIDVDEKTGFPVFGGNMASGSSWSSGQTADEASLRRKAEENPQFAEDYLYIIDAMDKVNIGRYIWESFSENEYDITATNSGWGGTWGGHAVPNTIDFARLGTDGIREKIYKYREINPESEDFYEGLLLTLEALDIFSDRFCKIATEKYNSTADEICKKKLKRAIDTFSHCTRTPAHSFEEAVVILVMLYSLEGIDSPGHFDQYMWDFWKASDYASSREALEDIWQYFYNTRAWNLCISGSDENWNDLTNELTYEILDVAVKYKYNTPNITMRCHRNTPEKLLLAAARAIGTGIGMPTLYNDEAVCPALESMGIPPEDSHRYVMNGCNQIDIQGKSHMGLEDGEVNLGMAVEYAVFNGINQKTKKLVGIKTGEADELDSFEKFYSAVKQQIYHLTDAVCSMANKAQEIYSLYSSTPIRSLTIEGCIEKGLDYKNHGPLYGNGQVLLEGVPDAVDSIANIKKFVYEKKKYTLKEVQMALSCDFEGYEEMYLTFKNSGLNFGNDIEYVDSIAADLINGINSYLLKKPTFRGGYYSGGCSPFNRAANNGGAVGALPNGKKATECLYGDSIGATPGKDKKGPTALLCSCLAFDHTLAGSGFILNLKFDKALFNSEKGTESFLALTKAYFMKKGQQLSVTVVNREDLIAAKKEPEKYKDIIVRVGGFSEYFVNLTPELQENVISRTDYSL